MVQGFANAPSGTSLTLFRSLTSPSLILSFPGTVSPSDLFTDVSLLLVPYISPGISCPGCKAHSGVLSAWNGIYSQAKDVLDQALEERPGHDIVIVGHSLGGAIAQLAFNAFVSAGYPVSMAVTYGQFRVGDQGFADFVDGLAGANDDEQDGGRYFRVTHADGEFSPRLLSSQVRNPSEVC